jgi:lysylphosphatidylglycerol synthetase-like protein (DUF2156 family)
MNSWLIFMIGIIVVLALTIIGVLLYRRKHPLDAELRKTLSEARLLLSLLYLAVLCILVYIAFAFGKR